jgi:hypothetical protein
MLNYVQSQIFNLKKSHFEKKYYKLCKGSATILKEKKKHIIAEHYSFYLPSQYIDNAALMQFNDSSKKIAAMILIITGNCFISIAVPQRYRVYTSFRELILE